jgi:hypothetical protein
MITKYIFTSPTEIIIPRKTKTDKKVSLNINWYRNVHYLTNNTVKKEYNGLMLEQLKRIRFNNEIDLSYQLYRKGKRILDSMNMYSIISKYFQDALVKHGCIKDDNDTIIKQNTFLPTIYNHGSNYCEITIVEKK